MITKALSVLIGISLAGLAAWAGVYIPISVQVTLLDTLMSLSIIVFGVVGVWLAIVYPGVMTGIYKAKSVSEQAEVVERSEGLLLPLLVTSGVVVSLVIAIFLVPALRAPLGALEGLPVVSVARAILFSYSVIVATLLSFCLLRSIYPALAIYREARRVERRNRLAENLFGKGE